MVIQNEQFLTLFLGLWKQFL